MKTVAEHFEQRYQRSQFMQRIEREKPRLAQIIAVLRVQERQRESTERSRKRK